MESLAIIGAGPKAIAIAIKAQLRRQLGLATPDITIYEKNAIAGNWCGKFGYTDGNGMLGTAPEKDLCFPYQIPSSYAGHHEYLLTEMVRFSWTYFLKSTHRYVNWVNRGKPAPKHNLWANYLQWAAAQLDEHTQFCFNEIVQISLTEQQWCLLDKNGSSYQHDSLLLTGPGLMKRPCFYQTHENIFDTENFWQSYKDLSINTKSRIAIIGAGENAASMALALGERDDCKNIDIINAQASVFSRGESHFENQFYSDPQRWQQLSLSSRKEFISRTDLGVFSQSVVKTLSHIESVHFISDHIQQIKPQQQALQLMGLEQSREYDYVCLATGFNQSAWLAQLCDAETQEKILQHCQLDRLEDELLALALNADFSLANLQPKLYIPMLSGLKYGPGFPNLSSLGLLADTVLSGHCQNALAYCENF